MAIVTILGWRKAGMRWTSFKLLYGLQSLHPLVDSVHYVQRVEQKAMLLCLTKRSFDYKILLVSLSIGCSHSFTAQQISPVWLSDVAMFLFNKCTVCKLLVIMYPLLNCSVSLSNTDHCCCNRKETSTIHAYCNRFSIMRWT